MSANVIPLDPRAAAPGSVAERRPLRLAEASLRQFRLLWLSRRPAFLFAGLFAVLMFAGWWPDPLTRLLTPWPVWLVLVGPVWALAVWHDEQPSRRIYMWSQPVGRVTHSVARVLAGLAWLWILYAALIAAGWVAGTVEGDAGQLGAISPAGWLNFFTAPVVGYLAVSCLTVSSEYPLRWLFGILLGLPLLGNLMAAWIGMERVMEVLTASTGWDPLAAIVGPWVTDTRALFVRLSGPDFEGFRATFQGGDTWWLATPLWIVVLTGMLALLASRHPDRALLPRRNAERSTGGRGTGGG